MPFTKVAPAGIGTEPGSSILIGDSLLHSTGIDIGSNTGVGVTIRQHGDATFSGIITASKFVGDISDATGGASGGLGTALSQTQTDPLNKIYYTDKVLSISTTQTIDHPATANLAYTQYGDIKIEDGHDLIVKDGDDFKFDILGISTTKLADNHFPNGLTGDLTGNVTGTAGTFTGNLNVGGVLTYEDVTNVDSVGVITARTDINLGDSIIHIGDTNTKIRFPSADTITAETGGSERLRIDSSGRVLMGHTASVDGGSSLNAKLQVSGTSFESSTINLQRYQNNSPAAAITFSKSRNATQGSHTILQDGDEFGKLIFYGSDGNDFQNEGARISSNVDGTPGNNAMPGSLRFYTTQQGAIGSSERFRIASDGKGFFNTTSAVSGNAAAFQVRGGISIDNGTHYRYIYQSGTGHVYFANGSNQAYLSTSGTWTDASDINIKKDITDLSYGIDSLKNLKPRKFKMKSNDKEQIGFIAQEVESTIPEVVDTGNLPDGTEQKGLSYGHLTAVLTKALQEAIAKIETLEAKVAALEGS